MAVNIKPLDDRILVKQAQAEEKTAGGIVLPDTAREKPQRGEVIAVGDGKLNKDGSRTPLEVKKGDNIFYGKFAGTEVEIEGEQYVIIRESDILAVIED